LLQVLAHHSGQLTNFTQIGGQLGIDDKTTRRYIGILEQLFLVQRVSPWFRNRINRLVKTPKLHFLDSGLLAAMQGLTAEQIAKNRSRLGALLETFVFSEILKQTAWIQQRCTLSHYRDKDQDEVDFIVEDERGAMVGIEVKASATVRSSDFKGIRKLLQNCGVDLKLGVVLYDGETIVPFGDRLFAAPISCLWSEATHFPNSKAGIPASGMPADKSGTEAEGVCPIAGGWETTNPMARKRRLPTAGG